MRAHRAALLEFISRNLRSKAKMLLYAANAPPFYHHVGTLDLAVSVRNISQ